MVKNTPLVYSTLHYVLSNIQYFYMFLLIIVTGADPGGGGPPKKKLEKIWFFGVKSWFFTRNTQNIFAPPSARRNFFKCAPLTWNPGSAAELGLDMVNQMAINGGIQDHEISQHLGMTFIIPFVMII
jgi:hypothetical protein